MFKLRHKQITTSAIAKFAFFVASLNLVDLGIHFILSLSFLFSFSTLFIYTGENQKIFFSLILHMVQHLLIVSSQLKKIHIISFLHE